VDRPRDLGQLNSEEWNQLQDRAEQLEQAWEGSDEVDLAQFLPAPGSPLRLLYLHELIKTELQIRWHRKQTAVLEQYQQQFPELGALRTLTPDLLYEEYRARQLYGDRPEVDIYRARFPNQFADLQRLIREQPIREPYTTLRPPTVAPPPKPGGSHPPRRKGSKSGSGSGRNSSETLPALDGYQLLHRIGSGQFGEVFRGEAPGGVEVAIKRVFRPLDHESCQREQHSLELIRSLHHPFLLQTQAYGTLDGRLAIIMELAEGSLKDRLDECRKVGRSGVPTEELLVYFREAAEALDYLHSQHVLHRDIKPENLLRLKGHAKVADFGLARFLEDEQATGTMCGTPVYMAPEVWRSKVSKHSDQYSLALTYIEMRTGQRVYTANDPYSLANLHLNSTPDLRLLEGAEQQVLMKALAKEPEQRFETCSDFVAALQDALHPVKPLQSSTRWKAIAPVGALATIVLAVLIAFIVNKLLPSPTPSSASTKEVTPVALPPGYLPSTDAEIDRVGDKSYYRSITYVELKDSSPPLEFVLVPYEGLELDPRTFYISRYKITYSQFKEVMFRSETVARLKALEASKPWAVKKEWQTAGGDDKPRQPVRCVTAVQANLFATMIRGEVPSREQWNKAAGKLDGQVGPFLPADWEPGISATKLTEPGEVDKINSADKSIYGCRGMAATGREWTRNLWKASEVNFDTVSRDANIEIRGALFDSSKPYRFAGDETPEQAECESTLHDLGFRVVLVPGKGP
jgi:serine/threonine protein kinase